MSKETRYARLAGNIEKQIRNNVFKVGDRLPSLRDICRDYDVSMNTALQSYFTLETKGLIESRPQSGYYVSFSDRYMPAVPATTRPLLTHGVENTEDLLTAISGNQLQSKISLSSGVPDISLLPVAKLNKAMTQAMRNLPDSGISYSHRGNSKLARHIAKRAMVWGGTLTEQDIITTAGCMDALSFCLMSLAEKGDTIAVESPVYFGILQLAKSLGLNVLELPTNAVTGIDIDALKRVLEKKKVKVCLFISNFSNPLGSCMPDEHKKAVVRLLEKYNVPLIEDDLYGDLYFEQRPSTCKTYDESGLVLWCGSFSKTLAPGYRVGWVAPGKYRDKLARMKWYHSVSTNTLAHEAIAQFIENEKYDKHLYTLQRMLQANMLRYQRCISEYFPGNVKVSRPEGGFFLWVELPAHVDVLQLYDRAIQHKISITPGPVFTLQKQYRNCFRLSFGLQWSDKVESALKLLGKLSAELS